MLSQAKFCNSHPLKKRGKILKRPWSYFLQIVKYRFWKFTSSIVVCRYCWKMVSWKGYKSIVLATDFTLLFEWMLGTEKFSKRQHSPLLSVVCDSFHSFESLTYVKYGLWQKISYFHRLDPCIKFRICWVSAFTHMTLLVWYKKMCGWLKPTHVKHFCSKSAILTRSRI